MVDREGDDRPWKRICLGHTIESSIVTAGNPLPEFVDDDEESINLGRRDDALSAQQQPNRAHEPLGGDTLIAQTTTLTQYSIIRSGYTLPEAGTSLLPPVNDQSHPAGLHEHPSERAGEQICFGMVRTVLQHLRCSLDRFRFSWTPRLLLLDSSIVFLSINRSPQN